MTTIAEFAAKSFEERPVLVSEMPYGRRFWLERGPDGAWWGCDAFEIRRVPADGDADRITRDWLEEAYEFRGELLASCTAGVEIGQCTECEAWVLSDDWHACSPPVAPGVEAVVE